MTSRMALWTKARAVMLPIALLSIALPGMAGASELDDKMGTIVRAFVHAAEARTPAISTSTLAVFPFQTDEKLAKKRVDFAVGELLTQRLLADARFRLVERGQLETILKEQKLGLTGALDSDTAAKVGRVLGARLAATGSVSRLGKSYQISATLVDTETSEIIAASVVQVRTEVFDEEASRYLVLVPETQAIGLFIGIPAGFATVKKAAPATLSGDRGGTAYSATATPTGEGTSLAGGFEFGVRYSPSSRWMLEGALLVLDLSGRPKADTSGGTLPPASGAQALGRGWSYTGLRVSVSRIWAPSERWRSYGGAGLALLEPGGSASLESVHRNFTGAGGQVEVAIEPLAPVGETANPFAVAGIEWRPQARFGWALFGQLTGGKRDFTSKVRMTALAGLQHQEFDSKEVPFSTLTMPLLTVSMTFSFYF